MKERMIVYTHVRDFLAIRIVKDKTRAKERGYNEHLTQLNTHTLHIDLRSKEEVTAFSIYRVLQNRSSYKID